MPVKVIELNDSCLTVGDQSGIISKTSGVALIAESEVIVGAQAERNACLRPTEICNKYWHELGLEPIPLGLQIRHYADVAYAQLMSIAEESDLDGDVILSVPSSFTRQQLEILLGLAKQCPFKVVGLVDTALLAAATARSASHVIYVDIQLHQVLITELSIIDNQLAVQDVTQLPGVGLQNFKNLLMQMATDLFISQCRFNPQHNASSEQELYNKLGSWFLDGETDQTLLLELESGDAVHRAKLPKEDLAVALSGYYEKINESIKELLASGSQILVSENIARLPSYISTMPPNYEVVLVDQNRMIKVCHEYESLILSRGDEIHLITKLASERIGINKPLNQSVCPQGEVATHILYENRAIKIDDIEIKNSVRSRFDTVAKKAIYVNLKTSDEQPIIIKNRDGGIYINCRGHETFLNDSLITGEHSLELGDRLRFSKKGRSLSLIKVDDGQ